MKVKKEDLHESGRPLSQSEFIERVKNDEEFAKRFGDLGPIYGSGWRNFEGIDQITELIHGLKTNPDSRRLRVSAWQPHKLKDMVLPPCHTDFQLYTRELSNDEIINYYYKNIKPNSKWKKDDNGKYFYFIESDDENYWVEHSTSDIIFGMKPLCPTRAISLMWSQRSVNEKSAA